MSAAVAEARDHGTRHPANVRPFVHGLANLLIVKPDASVLSYPARCLMWCWFNVAPRG